MDLPNKLKLKQIKVQKKTTLENVYHFEKIIAGCRDATAHITSVSNHLISNIHKLASDH